MVENPLYEGPIYEVISENKKRKQLLPKTKVHAEESLYLDSPTQSMPRDCVPSYDTSGAVVVVNDGKQYEMKLEGLTTLENSLDHHHLQANPYANASSVDQPSEDAYTLMQPATAASLTCHTNYLATSNGAVVNGRYVVDVSSPYSSGTSSQKQVTLV